MDWLKTILVFLLLTTSAAAQSGQRGRCVPSPQDDCAGGYWATVKDQCSWMTHLVCKQFEDKSNLCYRIQNPNACIDGSSARHFERKIGDKFRPNS